MSKTSINIKGAGGGKSGGGGGGGGIESPDDFSTRAFVEVLEVVSEGPIGGLVAGDKSIFLDDTALRNDKGDKIFKGVGWAQRKGTPNQSVIKHSQTVGAEDTIGVRITDAAPVTRTISDQTADRAVVTLGFPQLAFYDLSNGDIVGTPCQMKMTIKANGGDFQPYVNPHEVGWSVPSGYGTAPNHWAVKADQNAHECELYLWREADESDVTVSYSTNNGASWESWGLAEFSYDIAKKRYRSHVNVTLVGLGNLPLTVKWEAAGDSPPTTLSVWMESAVFHYLHGQLNCGGKSMSRAQRQFHIDFEDYGEGPWEIKVERVTPDSTESNRKDESWWDLLRTEKLARLTYPYSAMMWLRIPAARFSNIPSRKYLMKLLLVKIPSNYNPKTRNYAGVWDGTFQVAWTDNPAWCFYDLSTDARYGLGQYISTAAIDKWSLYTLAQYCDELVDSGYRKANGAVIYEPRFTCNVYIRQRAEAYKVLLQLSTIFRGMLFVAGGVMQASADRPADPVQLFSNANILEGRFEYSGSAHRTRHTVALVEWRDPDDMYRPKIEYVEDRPGIDRYGVNQTEVIAVGATSRGQARRQGLWILQTELDEQEMIAFGCGLDGAALKPGDIVLCQDNYRTGIRYGGRASAATLSSVTLDAPFTIEAGQSYQVTLMLADGALATRDVANAPGETTLLTLSSNLPSPAAENALWAIAAATVSEPAPYRIINIKEGDGITAQISAIAYHAAKYAAIETASALGILELASASPMEHAAVGTINVEQGTAGAAIFSWEQVPDTIRYYVRWRGVNGVWQFIASDDPSIELANAPSGEYEIGVTAMHPSGRVSVETMAAATLAGQSEMASLRDIDLPINDAVTGQVPKLIASLLLPAGMYSQLSATLGCDVAGDSATLELRTQPGDLLKSLANVGAPAYCATTGFTLTGDTQVEFYLLGNNAATHSFIYGIQLN
jgi:predicted phage tail protein